MVHFGKQRELPFDPAIPLLSIYLRETKNVHTKTYMPIFITASFIVVKGDNNPHVHQLDEEINKMWYIYGSTQRKTINSSSESHEGYVIQSSQSRLPLSLRLKLH